MLVAQDRLGDARRDHANPKLACASSFDNRDVGEADILLDTLAKRVQALAAFSSKSAIGMPPTRAEDHRNT